MALLKTILMLQLYMCCKIPVKIVAILDTQLFESHLCQSMSVFLFDEDLCSEPNFSNDPRTCFIFTSSNICLFFQSPYTYCQRKSYSDGNCTSFIRRVDLLM